MKIRRAGSEIADKVELQMTPMIDIVFQLIAFFLFTFRIAAQEGDFNIRMPAPGTGAAPDLSQLPISIRLQAGEQGQLAGILLRETPLASFADLRRQIISIVGDDRGPGSVAEQMEIELDVDYALRYEYVVEAITAVTGYVTPENHVMKLIEKIRFTPPKKPAM